MPINYFFQNILCLHNICAIILVVFNEINVTQIYKEVGLQEN